MVKLNRVVERSTFVFLSNCFSLFFSNGGVVTKAVQWATYTNHGRLTSDKSYPYKEVVGKCNTALAGREADQDFVHDYAWAVPFCSNTCTTQYKQEELLITQLNSLGPLSIAVDATALQTYTGGVLDP